MPSPVAALAPILLATALSVPAQEPAPPAPPAPGAETPGAVVDQAEQRIYHPDDAGLRSLVFEVEREFAPGKTLWTVRAEWQKGAQARITASVDEAAPIGPAVKSQLRTSLTTVGEVFVNSQRGRLLSFFLAGSTAVVDGREDGMLRLRLVPKAGEKGQFVEKVLLFDEQKTLRKARTTLQDRSTLTETYDWRPVSGDDPRLLLASVTATLAGKSGEVTRTTTWRYGQLEGFHLITGQVIRVAGTQGAPAKDEEVRFRWFVVNGKALDDR